MPRKTPTNSKPKKRGRKPSWDLSTTPPSLVTEGGSRRIYSFPEAPAVGTAIFLGDHPYEVIGIETRTDEETGRAIAVIRWRGICITCHETFEQVRGLQTSPLSRNCQGCRQHAPGSDAHRAMDEQIAEYVLRRCADNKQKINWLFTEFAEPKTTLGAFKRVADKLVEESRLVDHGRGVYETT